MINRWLETKLPNGTVLRLIPTVGLKSGKAYKCYESEIDIFGNVAFQFQTWERVPNPEFKWEEVVITEATLRLITSARKFKL